VGSGKMIEVARLRITEMGRRAAVEDEKSPGGEAGAGKLRTVQPRPLQGLDLD
jgi:hypothetical protein